MTFLPNPSPQPWQDYGDFALPTTSGPSSPPLAWEGTPLPADVDEQLCIDNMFMDLYISLLTANRLLEPWDSFHALESFPPFFKSFFSARGWSPTSQPGLSQALPLITAWSADLAEVEASDVTFQSQITFSDFTGGKTFHSHLDKFAAFEPLLWDFCALHKINPTLPLSHTECSFLASFLQDKLLAPPVPAVKHIHWSSAPPIEVLPPAPSSPSPPPPPITSSTTFPPLGGTWKTVSYA